MTRLVSTRNGKSDNIRDAYSIIDICTGGTCFIGDTYAEVACIKDTSGMHTYIWAICVDNTCAGVTYIGVENLISWDSCICISANNSCKFAVLDLRLLANLKLSMLVFFCLHL